MKKTNNFFLYPFFIGIFCIILGAVLNAIYSVNGEVTLKLNESSNIVTNPREYQLTIQTKDKTKTISTTKLKPDLHFFDLQQYRIDDIIPEAYLDYRVFNKKDAALNPAINLNINGKNIWLLRDASFPEFDTSRIVDGVLFVLGDLPGNSDSSIPTYLITYQDNSWFIRKLEDPEDSKILLQEKRSFSIKEYENQIVVKHLISHAKVNRVAIPKSGGTPAIALYDTTRKSVTWVSKDYPFQNINIKDEIAYIHNKDFLLPFRISLDSLKLARNGSPKVSVGVTSNYKKHNYNIYLNHPLEYQGYTIILSAFEPSSQDRATLTVSKDPYTYLIYIGGVIILLAIMTMFCDGMDKD